MLSRNIQKQIDKFERKLLEPELEHRRRVQFSSATVFYTRKSYNRNL